VAAGLDLRIFDVWLELPSVYEGWSELSQTTFETATTTAPMVVSDTRRNEALQLSIIAVVCVVASSQQGWS
jgi:hypothetical protein